MKEKEGKQLTMADTMIEKVGEGMEIVNVVAEKLASPAQDIMREFTKRMAQRILVYVTRF